MYEIVKSFPSGIFKLKFPSKSVTVPLEVPFSITVAPITGSPLASTTFPVTFLGCAEGAAAAGVTIILFPDTAYFSPNLESSFSKTCFNSRLVAEIVTFPFPLISASR